MEPGVLEKCQELIGYRFTDPSVLALALMHSSAAPTRTQSNERLEFLGDSVLGLVVCHWLYAQYDDLMEGAMTKIKSAVVSRQTCAAVADETGLSLMATLSKGIDRGAGPPLSVSAAVLESIIGAIYIDGGLEPARQFILTHMRRHIDETVASEHQRNYKSVLQQYAQRQWGSVPYYQLMDEKGPDHSKCFEIAVRIGPRSFPSAWGKSKKEAEQEAARRALGELGMLADEASSEEPKEEPKEEPGT